MSKYSIILLVCLVTTFTTFAGCKKESDRQERDPNVAIPRPLHLDIRAGTADPAVKAVVDRVSQKHYQAHQLAIESMGLGRYGGKEYNMGYRNRDFDTKKDGPTVGNEEACLYLQHKFKEMGLAVSVHGKYKNVVGELKGTATPKKIYIIGAHYDHLSGDMPGGDDNASGTAAVLEAARVLSQYKFESTIRFISFNAEEDGMLGSADYVNNHVVPGGENIVGMINMDAILRPGSDAKPERPIDVEIETNGSLPWVRAYIQAMADYVPSLVMGDIWDGYDSTSDNDSFQDKGIPAFLVIENSDGDWAPPDPIANPYIHNTEDASDRLANNSKSPSGVTYDYAFATDITRTTVALIAQEAKLMGNSAADALITIREVMIPMPDGVNLAADLYMPVGMKPPERFPVLLEYIHIDLWMMRNDLDNAMPGAPKFRLDEDWLHNRFELEPSVFTYMRHQRDGAFWDRASSRDKYDQIKIPGFHIGGWYDSYRDSLPRMLENVKAPVKAMIGPWEHCFPHDAWPKPQMEWRHEAVRWFDHWLKGIDTGMMDEPRLAVYVRNWHPPGDEVKVVPGHWRWEDSWPIARCESQTFYAAPDHALSLSPAEHTTHSLTHKPSLGLEGGGPIMWWGSLIPDQQGMDDHCLVYESEPLEAPLEILGFPRAILNVSADVTRANWIVRISDVAPDGSVTQVGGAGFNGSHRRSARAPEEIVPGEVFPLEIST